MNHLCMRKQSFHSRQRGQGMTEYIIITALIAIAAIGVVTYFGHVVRAQVGGMAQELAGSNAQNAIAHAQKASTAAGKEADNLKKLDSYNNAIKE
jgi:pilus assembly protein Flp/PilA